MKRQTKDAVATRLWRVEWEGALFGWPAGRWLQRFRSFSLTRARHRNRRRL